MMSGAKPINWADDLSEMHNSVGAPLYKKVELTWSRPRAWARADRLPSFDTEEPFLYMLIRNHGNFRDFDRIEYVGLTTNPKTRFGNHATAKAIVQKHGAVSFSYAPIEITRGRNRLERISRALEEIEHLLIWSVSDTLENDRKMFTLPGMGTRGGNAWHVVNKGYRFHGRVPREIIFPWMLVIPGRDRTSKPAR